MPVPVLTPAQAAEWDQAAAAAGIGTDLLMETAGRAAAQVLAQRFPERLQQGVLIAAGTGNNGGDGWVAARALHRVGVPVWVAALPGEGSPLNQRMAELARAVGVRQVAVDGPWPAPGLVVDAILGTGARGAPREPAAALVTRLLDLRLPVVALDGPTGLDLGSGASFLPAHADLTITFGGPRRGHLLARDEIGDLVVVDIGLPPPDPSWPVLVLDTLAAGWLPRLHARDHKGDRGRLVVLGGNTGMTGALRIAARAGFTAGAGLVHAVAPAGTIEALRQAEPDVQTVDHPLRLPLTDALEHLLDRADAIVVGPGLGRDEGTAEFVLAAASRARAAVLDADALTVLQGRVEQVREIGAARKLVLTPHHGEFRTLFPAHARDAESDPWTAAAGAADAAGAAVLLKGVPTVIAEPGRPTLTVAAGNPGLATGGSGDLLSGLIGAALAQGMEPQVAAALGAQALGRAADLAARRTSARALRPMDVIAALPDLWRAWDVLHRSPPAPRPPVVLELERPLTG